MKYYVQVNSRQHEVDVVERLGELKIAVNGKPLDLAYEEVAALGMNVRHLRLLMVTAATLMTAAAVAMSGIIGWVGLVVPHVARLLVGPDFGRLLPMSLLSGAAFVVAADTLARTAAPIELPLSVLTATAGVPFFLWLLNRRSHT